MRWKIVEFPVKAANSLQSDYSNRNKEIILLIIFVWKQNKPKTSV